MARCKRCQGFLVRDYDGDINCVACGRPAYRPVTPSATSRSSPPAIKQRIIATPIANGAEFEGQSVKGIVRVDGNPSAYITYDINSQTYPWKLVTLNGHTVATYSTIQETGTKATRDLGEHLNVPAVERKQGTTPRPVARPITAQVTKRPKRTQPKPREAVMATKMISIAEASKILGLSSRTIGRRIVSGEITAKKEGRVWRVEQTGPLFPKPASLGHNAGVLSVTEASKASGYSKVRVTDLARQGRLVGAYKNNDGKWMFPAPLKLKGLDGQVGLWKRMTAKQSLQVTLGKLKPPPKAKKGHSSQPKPLTQESLNKGRG